MSLFRCVSCGCVENTALCGWAWEDLPKEKHYISEHTQRLVTRVRKLVCSACNPDIGEWHGRFPQEDATEAGYVPIPHTRYIELPKERLPKEEAT